MYSLLDFPWNIQLCTHLRNFVSSFPGLTPVFFFFLVFIVFASVMLHKRVKVGIVFSVLTKQEHFSSVDF